MDAAELVAVEYEPLPVLLDPEEAAKDELLLFPDVGTNIAGRAGRMDHDPTLFEGCDVVVSDTLVSQRMAACPLEVRSAAAEPTNGRITAWLSTQVPHRDHHGLCPTLGLDPHELRIIAPDVGGGFGAKAAFGAEEALIVWLAKNHGIPVRWTETRTESMNALAHGRGPVARDDAGRHAGRQGARLQARRHAGLWRLPRSRGLHAGAHRDARDRRLPHPPGRGRGPLGGHEHDADDDVPRRWKTRGGTGDRADDGSLRRRDRHGSGRGAAQELHPQGRVPAPDALRRDV